MSQMHFQFLQSKLWVTATGRVVWTSTANKTAGIEFLDLSQEARAQIEAGIFSINPTGYPRELHPEKEKISDAPVAHERSKSDPIYRIYTWQSACPGGPRTCTIHLHCRAPTRGATRRSGFHLAIQCFAITRRCGSEHSPRAQEGRCAYFDLGSRVSLSGHVGNLSSIGKTNGRLCRQSGLGERASYGVKDRANWKRLATPLES